MEREQDGRGLLFSYREEVMTSKISIRLFSKKNSKRTL